MFLIPYNVIKIENTPTKLSNLLHIKLVQKRISEWIKGAKHIPCMKSVFALLLTLKIFLLSIYHQMDDACEPFEVCISSFSFYMSKTTFKCT